MTIYTGIDHPRIAEFMLKAWVPYVQECNRGVHVKTNKSIALGLLRTTDLKVDLSQEGKSGEFKPMPELSSRKKVNGVTLNDLRVKMKTRSVFVYAAPNVPVKVCKSEIYQIFQKKRFTNLRVEAKTSELYIRL